MTASLDILPSEKENEWRVFAKDSMFQLGTIEWQEHDKKYDFVANANSKLMKLTQHEPMRSELLMFCRQQTAERLERGGNT